MGYDEKRFRRIKTIFLVCGILGLVSFFFNIFSLIISFIFDSISPNNAFRIQKDLSAMNPATFFSIISFILAITIAIIHYYVLKNGLNELGLKTGAEMKYFNNADKYYLIVPIFLVLYLFWTIIIEFLFLGTPIFVLSLTLIIILIVISIFAVIGMIYYGIFIYQIGKNTEEGFLKAGGIFFIFLPIIGDFFIFAALRRQINY
ncbi:MAG: DUF973 family protein [Promethearchaeota archaeon]|nr:MAG: DUF973 family protein [Candidatus Lokiarchaeota archaeon]